MQNFFYKLYLYKRKMRDWIGGIFLLKKLVGRLTKYGCTCEKKQNTVYMRIDKLCDSCDLCLHWSNNEPDYSV